MAHLAERLHRLKKLPSLNKLLTGSATRKSKPKKKQTWQAILGEAETWVASFR